MAPHSAHYWGLGPGQKVDCVTKTLAPECPGGQPPSYVVWSWHFDHCQLQGGERSSGFEEQS